MSRVKNSQHSVLYTAEYAEYIIINIGVMIIQNDKIPTYFVILCRSTLKNILINCKKKKSFFFDLNLCKNNYVVKYMRIVSVLLR